jgi:hypothetical protein
MSILHTNVASLYASPKEEEIPLSDSIDAFLFQSPLLSGDQDQKTISQKSIILTTIL